MQSLLLTRPRCRKHDLDAPAPHSSQTSTGFYYSAPTSPPLTPLYPAFHIPYLNDLPREYPDIIPRASPTLQRPRSYFAERPAATTYTSHSRPLSTSSSSSALESLRSLATALPPPSSSSSNASKRSKGSPSPSPPPSRRGSLWNLNYLSSSIGLTSALLPSSMHRRASTASTASSAGKEKSKREHDGRSKHIESRQYVPAQPHTATPTPAATPRGSFERPYGFLSASHGDRYCGGGAEWEDRSAWERPLPDRRPPVNGGAPKSLQLVTPIEGYESRGPS